MKIRKAAIIFPVIIAVIGIIGGSILIWYLFAFCLLLMLFGFLWARININGVEVKIHNASKTLRAGEVLEETAVIENHSRLPKFGVTVKEDTNMPGHNAFITLELSPESVRSWHSRTICHHRGLFRMGSHTISSTDPFGIVTSKRTSGVLRDFTVLPAALDIPLFQPEVHAEPGKGSVKWLRSGTSSTISRVREYASGDTLNNIHWPSTAHRNSLMVKVFEPEQLKFQYRHVWIVPDLFARAQFGSGEESTEEYSVTLAATIFNKYMENGKDTGIIISGDRRHLYLPDSGKLHREEVDRMLATVKAEGTERLEDLLEKEMSRFEAGSIVIIITSSGSETLPRMVNDIEKQGCMAVVVLLDPVSFGGTTGIIPAVKNILATGAQVYIVRKGQLISSALDSRRLTSAYAYGE